MPEERLREGMASSIWGSARPMECLLQRFDTGRFQLFFQLFQYACRIQKAFFSRSEGRETLYLLTVPSGLWIFSFLEERDGIFTDDEGSVLKTQKSDRMTYVEVRNIPAMGYRTFRFEEGTPEEIFGNPKHQETKDFLSRFRKS